MLTVRYVVVLDGLCLVCIADSATKTSLLAWLPEPAAADQSMDVDSSAKTPSEIVPEAEMYLRLLIHHLFASSSEDIHRAKHQR